MKIINLLALTIFLLIYDHSLAQDTLYYSKGKIKQIGNQQNGSYRYFDENGNLMAKGSFLNGKEHGEWFYYMEDGKLNAKTNFANGVQNGEYIGYFKDGSISSKYTLDSKGDLIGDYFKYFQSGKVKIKTTSLKKGTQFETEYIEYFENGNVAEKGKLNGSMKNGEWLYYNETGELKKKVSYKNDVVVSDKK